jgi:hypothetical protein
MTKPFTLDDDGQVTVVGPPGLQRFIDAVESSDDRRDGREDGPDR